MESLVELCCTSSESQSGQFYDLPSSFIEGRKLLKMTSRGALFSKRTIHFDGSMLFCCNISLTNSVE